MRYLFLIAGILVVGVAASAAPPYFATGIKIGEVTQESVIIWTRTTKYRERIKDGYNLNKVKREGEADIPDAKLPDDVQVEDMEGAVPGAPGEVRLSYHEVGDAGGASRGAWIAVDDARDYTHQFELGDLEARTAYAFTIEARAPGDTDVTATITGSFKTAPKVTDPAPVLFTVTTGQKYEESGHEDGHKIYPVMAAMKPDFFVHTGDVVYLTGKWVENADSAIALEHARHQWTRMYGYPYQIAFHRNVPSYFIKDDHDMGPNDIYPGHVWDGLTYQQGIDLVREQIPIGESNYRTVRWGKDLQFWMVEGRDFRSKNNAPDGPGKTIWGAKQMEWLKQGILASDATFRILISPTPIVGPDRGKKNDNHANAGFTHEGDEIRRWLRDNAPDVVTVVGDRHWQYMSVHPETGVEEFSCGPASDEHAGGWSLGFIEEYHRYLNVTGGFLSATLAYNEGTPELTFRYHDVDGKLNFAYKLKR